MQELHKHTETELVSLVKTGDTNAFRKIVDMYKESIIRTSYSIVHNFEDARDISQKVFIKAFKALQHFQGQSTLKTWLFRIAINESKDFLKINNRQCSLSDEEIFEYIPDASQNVINIIDLKEKSKNLSSVINKLPNKQREIIHMRYFLNLSIIETAQTLNVAEGTVKASTSQAILNLKKIIQTEGIDL